MHFLNRYILVAVILYLFLAAAGPAAPGPLGVGFVQSVKTFLINTLPFAIAAWGIASGKNRTKALMVAGYLLVSSILYVSLKNLPVAAGAPTWVSNGKGGVVDSALAVTNGGLVALAALL